MDLSKLKAKRAKLDERIRKAEAREREYRQRTLLKLAKKHGLFQMNQSELSIAFAKVAGVGVTESEKTSDTVAHIDTARTLTETRPETAPEQQKNKWGWQ